MDFRISIPAFNQIYFTLLQQAARVRPRPASQHSPDPNSKRIPRKRISEASAGLKIDEGRKNNKKAKAKTKSETAESSTGFCEICQDFVPTPLMFMISDCDHCNCRECISGHVGDMLRQNIIKVNCPVLKCDVELKPSYFRRVLPQEVVSRWETVLRESVVRF